MGLAREEEGIAAQVLQALGVQAEDVRRRVMARTHASPEGGSVRGGLPSKPRFGLGGRLFTFPGSANVISTVFARAIDRAGWHASSRGGVAGPEHLLAGALEAGRETSERISGIAADRWGEGAAM